MTAMSSDQTNSFNQFNESFSDDEKCAMGGFVEKVRGARVRSIGWIWDTKPGEKASWKPLSRTGRFVADEFAGQVGTTAEISVQNMQQ
jgi:hypothetical protein